MCSSLRWLRGFVRAGRTQATCTGVPGVETPSFSSSVSRYVDLSASVLSFPSHSASSTSSLLRVRYTSRTLTSRRSCSSTLSLRFLLSRARKWSKRRNIRVVLRIRRGDKWHEKHPLRRASTFAPPRIKEAENLPLGPKGRVGCEPDQRRGPNERRRKRSREDVPGHRRRKGGFQKEDWRRERPSPGRRVLAFTIKLRRCL